MSVPAEIAAIVEKLDRELNLIQQNTTQGSNLTGELLSRFPSNAILTQCFAYFNMILFILKITKIQIETIFNTIASNDVPPEIIRGTGDELESLLSKVLELKVDVNRTKNNLENWQ